MLAFCGVSLTKTGSCGETHSDDVAILRRVFMRDEVRLGNLRRCYSPMGAVSFSTP